MDTNAPFGNGDGIGKLVLFLAIVAGLGVISIFAWIVYLIIRLFT